MADVIANVTPGVVITPSISETPVSSVVTSGSVINASASETTVEAVVQASRIIPTATNGSVVNVVASGVPIVTSIGIGGLTTVAGDIFIADAGEYYTGEDVEAALQEIGDGTTLDGRYLMLDASNDPITGSLSMGSSSITNVGHIAFDSEDAPVAKLSFGVNLTNDLINLYSDDDEKWGMGMALGEFRQYFSDDNANYRMVWGHMAEDDTFTEFMRLTFAGQLGIGKTPSLGALDIVGGVFSTSQNKIDGSADEVQFIVQANATQTANLIENQLSDTTVVSGADKRGVLFSHGGIDINSVFIGNFSGLATATGVRNTGIGGLAFSSLTSGNDNVALGYNVLSSLTEGSFNMGQGQGALDKLTTGDNNIAVGFAALNFLTVSDNNVAIGRSAGLNLASTSRDNVLIGNSTLDAAFTSAMNENVIIGHNAATSFTGSPDQNVVIGDRSGLIIAGNSNIILGHSAGDKHTGSNTLIVDNQSRADIATEITNAILYGVMAAAPADQTLRINAAGLITDKLAFTQIDGNEYIDSLADGYLDYRATTGHRFGDGTNETQILSDGDVVFVGTAGLQFAQIYEEDGVDTLALAAQDTQYQVVSFTVDGESNGATPDHTNDHITVAVDGKYKSAFSVSFSQTAAVSIEYDFHIKINNGATDFPQTSAHRNSGGVSAVGNCGGIGLLDLSAGDTVELWVERLDGGAVSRTITFRALSIVLTQVGGT